MRRDSRFNYSIFRSGNLKQSFTSSRNQYTNRRMSNTTVTRQPTKSDWNVELGDHSELDAIEKESRAKNSKKGKAAEMKQQTAVNLGEVAWDEMFAEGCFRLTHYKVHGKSKTGSNRGGFPAYQERNSKHTKRLKRSLLWK